VNISISERENTREINVLGELDKSDDIHHLLAALKTRPGYGIKLSLYDAHTLPATIVEGLVSLLDAGVNLKIDVYHSYLVRFLGQLGLAVNYVPRQSIKKTNACFSVVALAGSAESLDKILFITEHLPKAEVAVFIVQHIREDVENYLDQLLKVRTDYQVIMPQHMLAVQPATIYIAPPGHHLKVSNGLIYLTRDGKVNMARPSIDVLFDSLATEYGAQVLAVLLCGFGNDGIKGIAKLRDKGACVLLESSEECGEARVLPENAQKSGAYDYCLEKEGLACFLAAALVGRKKTVPPQLLDLLLNALFVRYGYDFSSYQQGMLLRRISHLMETMDCAGFFEFQRDLFSDPGVFERFFVEVSINVSSFFRHPEQFSLLREHILPYLNSFPMIKIWSAGCASGEEAYSLAILLDELGMLEKSQIFATDLNQFVLQQAKSGLFSLPALDNNRNNYLDSGGTRLFDAYVLNNGHYLEIKPRYRERILFHHHSLVHDGVFNEFQLILCRNVIIYFQGDLQNKVFMRFSRSLHPDGFLLMGPSDGLSIGSGEQFFAKFENKPCVFRLK